MRKADNLTTILGHCHVIWEPKLPGTLWAPRTCNGTDLPFFTIAIFLPMRMWNEAIIAYVSLVSV